MDLDSVDTKWVSGLRGGLLMRAGRPVPVVVRPRGPAPVRGRLPLPLRSGWRSSADRNATEAHRRPGEAFDDPELARPCGQTPGLLLLSSIPPLLAGPSRGMAAAGVHRGAGVPGQPPGGDPSPPPWSGCPSPTRIIADVLPVSPPPRSLVNGIATGSTTPPGVGNRRSPFPSSRSGGHAGCGGSSNDEIQRLFPRQRIDIRAPWATLHRTLGRGGRPAGWPPRALSLRPASRWGHGVGWTRSRLPDRPQVLLQCWKLARGENRECLSRVPGARTWCEVDPSPPAWDERGASAPCGQWWSFVGSLWGATARTSFFFDQVNFLFLLPERGRRMLAGPDPGTPESPGCCSKSLGRAEVFLRDFQGRGHVSFGAGGECPFPVLQGNTQRFRSSFQGVRDPHWPSPPSITQFLVRASSDRTRLGAEHCCLVFWNFPGPVYPSTVSLAVPQIPTLCGPLEGPRRWWELQGGGHLAPRRVCMDQQPHSLAVMVAVEDPAAWRHPDSWGALFRSEDLPARTGLRASWCSVTP